MSDIDYSNKSDRDLLIEVVVTTNSVSQKLGTFCDRVEILEKEHATLQKEHDMRGYACSPPPQVSKKVVVASAGAGGGIVGALIILGQAIIDYIGK